jgi:hypothetical protein
MANTEVDAACTYIELKGRAAVPRSWKPQAATSSVAVRRMKDEG